MVLCVCCWSVAVAPTGGLMQGVQGPQLLPLMTQAFIKELFAKSLHDNSSVEHYPKPQTSSSQRSSGKKSRAMILHITIGTELNVTAELNTFEI